MSERIYLVMGSSGEYSDRSEWCVCATSDEEQAKRIVTDYERLGADLDAQVQQRRISDIKARVATGGDGWGRYSDEALAAVDALHALHPDPNFAKHYGQASYRCVETQLISGATP